MLSEGAGERRPGEVSPPWSHLPLDFGPSHSVLSHSAGSADGPVHQEDNKTPFTSGREGKQTLGVIPWLQQGWNLPGRASLLHSELVQRLQQENTARRKGCFKTRAV